LGWKEIGYFKGRNFRENFHSRVWVPLNLGGRNPFRNLRGFRKFISEKPQLREGFT